MPEAQKSWSQFKTEKLPFDRIPHQSRLFLDFLQDSSALETFYPAAVSSIDRLGASVPNVLKNYSLDRERLADALLAANQSWNASPQTKSNIERLRRRDTVAVVTGQQAKLFTGALDTVYKAFSIVKVAEKLQKNGVNAVPVFWIASEDHDFAEIAETFFLDRENRLGKVRIETAAANEDLLIGKILLDDSIETAIERLFAALPKTEFSQETRAFIAAAYQPNRTISESFARLMTKLFGKFGLILLDPLDEQIKRLAAPIYQTAVRRSAKIPEGWLGQNARLTESGFHRQIKVDENSFPLFWLDDNHQRTALEFDGDKIKSKRRTPKIQFDINELSEIAAREPARLSPNATLRATVQDFLLPTIGYFGGAAEIADFAQTAAVYRILERPATAVFHRASVTIIEPNVRRTFEKYDLSLADFFAEPSALQAKIVQKYLDSDAARVLNETETLIGAQLNRLQQHLALIEPALGANFSKREQKILWHLAALKNKFVQAEVRRSATANQRMQTARAAVYPRAALQEQTLNIVSLLVRHGENVLDWIYAAIDADSKEHQILYL